MNRPQWTNGTVPTTEVYGRPDLLPARVVYSLDGRLIPAITHDPNHPPVDMVRVKLPEGVRRLPNGLTIKSEAMARLMARNVGPSDAFRSAYSAHNAPAHQVANRALRITRNPRFRKAVERYRAELEEEGAQITIDMGTFVRGRLVHEAQSAKQDGARIRALELLGKSVSMFTDVKRIETFTSSDVDKLKSQLNQRLTDLVQRLGIAASPSPLTGMSPSHGDERQAIPAPQDGTLTGTQPPLSAQEDPDTPGHINTGVRSSDSNA